MHGSGLRWHGPPGGPGREGEGILGKSETQPLSRPASASEGIVFDLPIQLGLGIQGVIRLPNPMTPAQWSKFESAIETVKQLKTLLVSDDVPKEDDEGNGLEGV